MDYRLALQNAQKNVELQKLELEKANKAIHEKPSQSAPNNRTGSSGWIDPAKVKQFMERRRQEIEAKKAAANKFPPAPAVPVHQKQPKNATDSKKNRHSDGASSRSDSASTPSSTQKRLSNGSSDISSAKKSKMSSESTRLPQPPPPPPPPSASAPMSGPLEMQRHYLMMRREELLKDLEKIDKKLRKLHEVDSKSPAPAQPSSSGPAKQSSSSDQKPNRPKDKTKDRPNLPSIKKLPPPPPPAPSIQQHQQQPSRHRSSTVDDYDDEEDDDDDNDSFIDDTDEAGVEDYAKIVREVHRSLKFDPRRYAAVNPHDDCRGMVASYRDIQTEERRSKRIGALEDAADLRDEAERRARREEKRKAKG